MKDSFCFIMCTNNDQAASEALYYISCLDIPNGYEVETLTIKDAKCMTAGYNAGMNSSDAKYKIYMHQDVLILNERFLFELLNIFEDPNIGMVGMVGSPKLPENVIMWNGPRVGSLYGHYYYETVKTIFDDGKQDIYDVEAVDGFLMATQYDVPWREDIFKGWDFYDVSQSFEYRKAGYKVVVPHQCTPWCLHDDGWLNLKNYFVNRKIFLNEYFNK